MISISDAGLSLAASHEQLMLACAAGDTGAFDRLYEHYRAPLYRFILCQVKDPVSSNDLYQQSWEKVIKGRHTYRRKSPFPAWLFRIARNTVIDHFRRQQPGLADDLADFLATEEHRRLVAAIDALPAGQLLRELDLLQSREALPDIEPPRLIDQAVRNMARRELPDSPAAPQAETLRWIAGLATVSIALIAVGISLVQSPPGLPSPAAPAFKTDRQIESRPGSPAESSLADDNGDMDEALAIPAQAWLDLIRQLYDEGLL
ncbi:MAG TPA: sigma-70 family RNA polymerase sigma factor, partial [Xanthomonadales bacterium]|nr:sigma-70 family RNA polymerase sigma factor [Xanthomonadales bacterium]